MSNQEILKKEFLEIMKPIKDHSWMTYHSCSSACTFHHRSQHLLCSGVKQFNTLSSLQPLPSACIGINLYQSPYWSQMKHWTHQCGLNASLLFNHLPFKSSPASHLISVIRSTSGRFALSFLEGYAIIINTSQGCICQGEGPLKFLPFIPLSRAAFLVSPIVPMAYS